VDDEFVHVTNNLSKAVHQLVMGCHQGLLVLDQNEIVGVLRLSDVFDEICAIMKAELSTDQEQKCCPPKRLPWGTFFRRWGRAPL